MIRIAAMVCTLLMTGCSFCVSVRQPIIIAPEASEMVRETVRETVTATTETTTKGNPGPVILENADPCVACEEVTALEK